jgi:hypothetical protein
VFIDLFNLTTFLVPRQFIPPLTQQVTVINYYYFLFCFVKGEKKEIVGSF